MLLEIHKSGVVVEESQADTWRLYNVVSTSMQRQDVASTLKRRCIDVMCLLGQLNVNGKHIYHMGTPWNRLSEAISYIWCKN